MEYNQGIKNKKFPDLSILITNDDGISSNRILLLAKVALLFSDHVTVVCPLKDMSGSGLSLTMRESVSYFHHAETPCDMWVVNGTPGDCVMLSMRSKTIMDKLPDIVVSGVNKGDNAGRTVLYSGTSGAAMLGAINGARAISLSQRIDTDLSASEHMTDEQLSSLLYKLLNIILSTYVEQSKKKSFISKYNDFILNVNIPATYYKDILLTRHCKSMHYPKWDKYEEINGIINTLPYFNSSSMAEYNAQQVSMNQDAYLLSKGYVTIAPIVITDFNCEEILKHNPWKFNTVEDIEKI